MADDTRESLLERPKALQDRIFQRLFDQAEIAKYSDAERRLYEASQKEYWDYTSTLETAERKGEVKGIQKEKLETVRRMEAKGYSVEDISEIAGLSIDEIRKILQ